MNWNTFDLYTYDFRLLFDLWAPGSPDWRLKTTKSDPRGLLTERGVTAHALKPRAIQPVGPLTRTRSLCRPPEVAAAGNLKTGGRLQSPLRKLEAVMTDDRGLSPHSTRCLAYWTSQLDKLSAAEELTGLIPLEAFDAIVAGGAGDATRATIARSGSLRRVHGASRGVASLRSGYPPHALQEQIGDRSLRLVKEGDPSHEYPTP